MVSSSCQESESFKYGAFVITDRLARWNGAPNIKLEMTESESDCCFMEGFWNPDKSKIKDKYETAVTGLCIWGKCDCLFQFKPIGKGNAGATRSFANPKDREDLLKRLNKKQKLEKILLSKNPFGKYQTQLMGWQKHCIKRFGIEKVYYALPIDEYMAELKELEGLIPEESLAKIFSTLDTHYTMLLDQIKAFEDTLVEFIYPMRVNNISPQDSYIWPYKNLKPDIGIEEMEEFRIIYHTMKNGFSVPPVIFGALSMPCPYYESRLKEDYLSISL